MFSTTIANVLFVTHKDKQCGVYQHGYNIISVLSKKSKRYKFIHALCSNQQELYDYIEKYIPIAIIYNYHSTVLGWISTVSSELQGVKQLAIHHEPSQPLPPNLAAVISQDPNIQETKTLFNSGRLILDYQNIYQENEIPVIGSFGFGLPGKGFQKLIELVQLEFDVAHIKLHISYATFGDASGVMARGIAEECRKLRYKPNVTLEIGHDFMDIDQLIEWLAQNTLNAFLHDLFPGRGNSGVLDYALSARRPIALTKSYMFRHLHDANPSIFIGDMTLKQIINNGLVPLQQYYDRWSEDQLVKTYDDIITNII
jgi:hypothetical protein